MITTLRTKLLIGLMPLLAIMLALGLWAISMFYRLGGRIDVILRENYHSVLAAEGMEEALERMDSALLFAISGGDEEQARKQFRENRPRFEESLGLEQRNVTLPGEQKLVDDVISLFNDYIAETNRYFTLPPRAREDRSKAYFDTLLPTFNAIKGKANSILEINQRNMEDERDRAREAAASSIRLMIIGLIGAAAVATLVSLALSRSLLGPSRGVTRGAQALAQGDLDQVVTATTRDELGELAQAFNTMARTIREFREAGTARLLRVQKTTQATIDSFPDPVVVVDNTGSVERANPAARRILGVAGSSDVPVPWSPPPILRPLLVDVLAGRPDHVPTTLDHAHVFRDEGQERFFLPRVLAIRGDDGVPLGAAVVLTDVTRFRLMDQLKNDMVSTVSHELKTPLTGVQMAIHLLLEEVVGPLNPKQLELLLAARQDSDRLLGIVNDLLDLTRIEQGRVTLDLKPVAPAALVGESVDRFASRAEDSGIALRIDAPAGLPAVRADRDRVGHVFDNLIGNALVHTGRGGSVALTAEADGNGFVLFKVADSGAGIPPEHLPRIFDKFYRVPGKLSKGGAGLGLAIAREIVTAHGGQIDAVSAPGAGTTFTFTLPMSPA
jgi:two-component system, NtrC family, sensor histidine kinase KinB